MKKLTYCYEFSFANVAGAVDILLPEYLEKFNENINNLNPIAKEFIDDCNAGWMDEGWEFFIFLVEHQHGESIEWVAREFIKLDNANEVVKHIIIDEEKEIVQIPFEINIDNLTIEDVKKQIKEFNNYMCKWKFLNQLIKNRDEQSDYNFNANPKPIFKMIEFD